MYNVLLTISYVSIFMCLSCFTLCCNQKESKLVKLMILVSACAFVENVGYLMELYSKNADMVLFALKTEYIGGAMLPHFFLMFNFEYNRIKIPKWLLSILFGLGFFTEFCVWSCDWNHLYYSSVEFVNEGYFPHVVLGKGPYYIFYAVVMYSELLASMIIMMRRLIQSKQKELRQNAILLFFAVLLPVCSHILCLCNIIDGYDTTPAGIALSVGIFGFTIGWQHLFDVVESAHEKLIESIDDAIVIVDPDLRFEEANDEAQKLLPFLKNIPRGKVITDNDFINIIKVGGTTDFIINDRFYDIHVNEILSGTSVLTGYSVVYFDVTEKKKQFDKMKELTRQANSANEAKSAFLANVSHEIRTPINAVLGFNEVIIRDYSEPRLLEYAHSIQSSASTLLGLINQLLDFSKIESGKMNIVNNVYDADTMFRDIISVNKFRAEQEGLKFVSEIDRKLPHFLYGDETRIRQIITNLLSNAIKYTSKGQITFTVQFEKISNIEGNIFIAVKDTGAGIKSEDMDKLFEGFVRLEEDKHKFVQGTGLGLNICKNLVDMMEGEITVDSKYGEGSVFRVAIPQKLVDEKVIATEEGSERVLVKWERDFTAPKANVLIVDDNNINLKVAKALLAPTLVQLDMVSSGNECLDAICRKKYDIIFLDHRMPGMDGVETLQTMKHMHHLSDRAKVIALTANVVNDAKAFYLGAGFDDFLAKPVTEERMDKMLERHLDPSLIEKV